MTEPRLWDTLEATKAGAFERLLASPCCPGPGDMLLAVAAEFRPVAAGRVSFRLDELARSLFDVADARDARAASHRLATLLTDELGFRTDDSSLDGLWVDAALERRAGHPLALAVIAAEIGRRAGIAVGICSTPTGWYAGIGEPERLWLIDPVLDPGPTPAGPGAQPLRPRGRLRRAHRDLRAAAPRRRRRRRPPGGAAARAAAGQPARVSG